MAESIGVGIVGAGWPGMAHAKGYLAAGGFKVVGVADLIPDRRRKLMAIAAGAAEFTSVEQLLADRSVTAVSICLPNDQHVPMAVAALSAGKHVLCETPPATDLAGARKLQRAAQRHGKVLMYALQRRFGGSEQAAQQAIQKQYAGDIYHVRTAWTRTRAIPTGTGWYTDPARAGGGVLLDLGLPMLDLGWRLLGEPAPLSAAAVTQRRFLQGEGVEDAVTALLRFAGNKTLELAAAWALNQPPQQNGALCRAYGDKGSIDVYTPSGAILYRDFKSTGESKATPLRPPKTTHYTALVRHFRQAILGNAPADPGPRQGITLMRMVEAIYKSAASGKTIEIKQETQAVAASADMA